MDLHNELRTLAVTLDGKFRSINAGGCGVVASLVANYLRHLTPVTIKVRNEETKQKTDVVRLQLNNSLDKMEWNQRGFYFHHIVVEFQHPRTKRTFVFDSHGVRDAESYWRSGYAGELTFDEVTSFAKDPIGWCILFDRSNIPEMEKVINVFFRRLNNAPPRPYV